MASHNGKKIMPFVTYQHMLRERLYDFIHTLPPLLKSDVRYALEQKGKLLCPFSSESSVSLPAGMWALLPLLIARDLKPDVDLSAASSVAIAVECLICALDLLDDVEDGDQTLTMRELGTARTLNVSTALLLMAQQALLSLSNTGISAERVIVLLEILQETTLAAATGQHGDLVAEAQAIEQYTEEDCICIARSKAGSLMRLACTIGSAFVGIDGQLLRLFAELGELLGIAHQLDNDSHDLHAILHSQEQELVKTDLKRHKKTLPLVLAAQIRASEQPISNATATNKTEQQTVFLNSLHEGIIATWGISLLYRERAYDCVQKIEVLQPLSHELRLLLGFA